MINLHSRSNYNISSYTIIDYMLIQSLCNLLHLRVFVEYIVKEFWFTDAKKLIQARFQS